MAWLPTTMGELPRLADGKTLIMASETLELTRQLLAFNTINPPGDEADCLCFLAEWLNQRGFEVTLTSFGERRSNLVARLSGQKAGKPLAFTGHVDTVPLGSRAWQYSPFDGEIAEGRLYGRGTSDMKAAIAAFVVACVQNHTVIREGCGVVLFITGVKRPAVTVPKRSLRRVHFRKSAP